MLVGAEFFILNHFQQHNSTMSINSCHGMVNLSKESVTEGNQIVGFISNFT